MVPNYIKTCGKNASWPKCLIDINVLKVPIERRLLLKLLTITLIIIQLIKYSQHKQITKTKYCNLNWQRLTRDAVPTSSDKTHTLRRKHPSRYPKYAAHQQATPCHRTCAQYWTSPKCLNNPNKPIFTLTCTTDPSFPLDNSVMLAMKSNSTRIMCTR